MRYLVAVALAALLLSCQSVVEPRRIAIQDPARPDFIVTIIDPGHVVIGARVLVNPQLPGAWDWKLAHIRRDPTSASMAEILWADFPCRTQPTISFDAVEDTIRILVDPGPLLNPDCDAMALPMGVAVTFSRPVSADQLMIEKSEPSN